MTTEGEFRFLQTLRNVKDGSQPPGAIVEDPEYQRRAKVICRGLAADSVGADELIQEVVLKVLENVKDHFTPDYAKPYGNFFAWFRRIARNAFLDGLPRGEQQFDDEDGEEFSIEDPTPNPEMQLLLRERETRLAELRTRLAELVDSLPRTRRLAMRLYLKGHSYRRAAQILNRLNIKCSHAAVRNWVREDLAPFFRDGRESAVKRASGF